MRVLRDLHRVAENMRFSSHESLGIAVDVLSELIRSMAPQIIEDKSSKYGDRIMDALYRLISSLFYYPDRERAAEAYLVLCKKLDEEPLTKAPQEAGTIVVERNGEKRVVFNFETEFQEYLKQMGL